MVLKLTLISLFVISLNISAIVVDGYAYLDDQSDHTGIMVLFERIAPTSLIDSTLTNSDGHFNIDLETGIYDITYSKLDYYPFNTFDNVLYSDTILEDETLYENILFIRPTTSVPDVIQQAINICSEGDTVLLDVGTYYEGNISFPANKALTIASLYLVTKDTTYISQTIIDGGNVSNVITYSNENPTPQLIGFTIQNGDSGSGGGIYCENTNPVFDHLIIKNNSANQGGGIYLDDSSPQITNCVITDNVASAQYFSEGGGIRCQGSSNPHISDCIISNNQSHHWGGGIICGLSTILENCIIAFNQSLNGDGGGVICGSTAMIINCTITNNSSSHNGGGVLISSGAPTLTNCIISENYGYKGIYNNGSGEPSLTYSNAFNNEYGNYYNMNQYVGQNLIINTNGDSCDAFMNIQLDPLFVNPDSGNYHLTDFSPCIDAGNPSSPLDPDGTIADMGANYFDQGIQPLIADFNSDVVSGFSPLEVHFTDESYYESRVISEWLWDFGDSQTSIEQHPSHIYNNPGYYTVSLTVTDENDSTDTEIKVDYITIFGNDPPAAPENVTVTLDYPDAIISWSLVDTTIYGDPIIPDLYIIQYSEVAEDTSFYYLNFVYHPNNEFTHERVLQFGNDGEPMDNMFYRVKTIAGLTREQIEYVVDLNSSNTKLKWSVVRSNLNR